MAFLLEKDGIRQEVLSPVDVARLKLAGYKEVIQDKAAEAPREPEAEPTPEQQNAEAITAANKPAGSRKARK